MTEYVIPAENIRILKGLKINKGEYLYGKILPRVLKQLLNQQQVTR